MQKQNISEGDMGYKVLNKELVTKNIQENKTETFECGRIEMN